MDEHEVRCPTLMSRNPERTVACGATTVVVERFEWGGKNIEVHQCSKGHVTEWEAHPDEQG